MDQKTAEARLQAIEPAVRRRVRRQTRDEDLAATMVSEGLLVVWQALTDPSHPKYLLAQSATDWWLTTLAAWRGMDQLRKITCRTRGQVSGHAQDGEQAMDLWDQPTMAATGAATPIEQAALDAEVWDLVREVVATLTDAEQRSLKALFLTDGKGRPAALLAGISKQKMGKHQQAIRAAFVAANPQLCISTRDLSPTPR